MSSPLTILLHSFSVIPAQAGSQETLQDQKSVMTL